MPPRTYRYEISENVFITIHFVTSKGHVTEFVIKLELLVEKKIYEVIRYDTAHGGTHKDILHPDGSKHDLVPYHYLDVETGFQFAAKDVKSNWKFYVERFLRWLRKEEKK